MPVHLLHHPHSPTQLREMLEAQVTYIKLAVDIARGIAAGGGEYHADCEEVLLEDGSRQEDIWGADWYPETQAVTFGTLINIRPRQNNRSMEIQDTTVRVRVDRVVRTLFEEGGA
jgi:Protein of unknown function (DUF5674)